MPTQDASHIRERILSIIRMKGPILPIFISQDIGISMLFTSAFLSELLSDKLVKMSHMRVGNSPIYFIAGQEPQLEKFSNYLKSKEKDAFHILQQRKFLKDSEQIPAIRVALREIKDFAFPFRKNNEIYWRYLTSQESEFKQDAKPIEEHKYVQAKPKIFKEEERQIADKIMQDINVEEINQDRERKEKIEIRKDIERVQKDVDEIIEEIKQEEKPKQIELEERKEKIEIKKDIEEIQEKVQEEHIKEKKKPVKEKEEKHKIKVKPIRVIKKKEAQNQNDKFFDKIKEFLSKETIEIVNIESFNKNEILLRIKYEGQEKLLVAYNKKKILDTDIINANKKASKLGLKYLILSMGEPSKKLLSLIESAQNLEKMEKIEK